MQPSDVSTYTSWQAKKWPELRNIWQDLDVRSDPPSPRFRSEPITPQQAGWVFQRLVLEALRLGGFSGHNAYVVPMSESGRTREEIDGLVFESWHGFLLESKYQKEGIDFGPIARLHILVEQRIASTLGLFFSAFGYTAPALESAQLLRPIRVLLFDGIDLEFAFQNGENMRVVIERKWKLALKYARPNIRVEPYDSTGEFPGLPSKGVRR